MAFPKGKKNPNAGRKVGSTSTETKAAREAIAHFVEANCERLSEWLDQIAVDSPEKAFNAVMSVVEYHIPKLARQEISGNTNMTLTVVTGVKPKND